MRKRIIVLIVALALVCLGGGAVLIKSIADVKTSSEQDATKKAEKETGYIVELFHDQGHIYMTPDEPKVGEDVTIRLRTERYNVTRAQIQYTTDNGRSWKVADMKFEKQDDTGYYDLWKGEIPAEGDLIYYRFIVSNKEAVNTVYYDKKGVTITEGQYKNGWQIVPGHDVPDWAKGALWYAVLPDAFYNGNTTNDKRDSGDNTYVAWNKLRKDLSDKYGGDIEGIESQLDYIQSLYADAIYMNPIHKSYQSAGYGPVRYDEVESSFGNEEDLQALSDAIHERDMKLMGDVVLTFALDSSYYFNKEDRWPVVGAYQAEDSEYSDMFAMMNWPDHYLLSWSSPTVNLNSDIAKNILYANKDSYLEHYASVFDGYRFDCGGNLWGLTETDDLESYTFIKEIREKMKAVNEDFFLLTEYDGDNRNTGVWDSSWNINYIEKMQDYASGLINETLMLEAMYDAEMTLPRNVALCLQNMMCDHDNYRVVQHDDYMYNSAALIQMTYLGSPFIYYGEEIDYIKEATNGVGRLSSFYSMEWDESNWDYARLNFYKATGELRQEYSCVKTGVANILGSDDAQNMIMFGRWDKNGATITVTSQNEDVITVEIPVNKCDIANGTIMTDWYTGEQYVVEDGKIKADIIPGGTVLVTGKKSSSYRQTFEQSSIGAVSKNDSILTKNTASFVMEGKGTIEGKADNFTFANTVAYDDFAVYANLKGDGEGALMIRNGQAQSDLYYAAVVKGDKLSIVARTGKGESAKTIVEVECTKNTYIKLVRTGANEFKAYRTEVQDGNLGTWEEIKKSTVSIGMNNKVYYGFSPLNKEMRINNVTFEVGKDAITYDTFDNEVTTTLLDNTTADFVSIKDGKLTITNSKKQQLHYLLTNSMDNDWTFKAKVDYKAEEGQYAGVVCQQDENNYIVAGRTLVKGKPTLFLGKASNGSIAMYGTVEDPAPDKDVIIQLQRIGAFYSAVYSDDDGQSWKYIGRVYTNFANERVGILLAGEKQATFDWVSFGDSINDGVSTNTPQTPIAVDTTCVPDVTADECNYEFLSGDWKLVTGGWAQDEKKEFSQASATNKLFYNLYAEATVEVTSGSGWAGLAFGKSTPYTDASDGYILKYYKNGELVLTYKGEKLASCKLQDKENATRLVVDAADGRIVVYAGMDATPVMCLNNTGYYNGYVSFCTDKASAEFRNFHHGSTDATWTWISSEGEAVHNSINTKHTTYNGREMTSICTLPGYAFTDFVATAKLDVTKQKKDLPTASGLLLCASEGKPSQEDGIFVYIDGEGKLALSVNGTDKASYTLPNTNAVTIFIVKQGGTYKVYMKGVAEPILEYTENYNRGGVLALHTINGAGTFVNVKIENLQPGQDYSATTIAKTWNSLDNNPFVDKFETEDAMNQYMCYNKGAATFDDVNGVLRCYNSTGWTGGITVMENTYSDFTMEFDLRIDAKSSGWMSIGLRKNNPYGNHNNSGVSVMVGTEGTMYFFSSTEKKSYAKTTVENFEVGKWYKFKIVANGKNLTLYVNGQKIGTCEDNHCGEGYVSFTSGVTNFSVDNLKITPN